jgi:hypothetical protein
MCFDMHQPMIAIEIAIIETIFYPMPSCKTSRLAMIVHIKILINVPA